MKLLRTAQRAHVIARENCILIGAIALALLVVGFVASDGYFADLAAISMLLFIYSGFLFLSSRSEKTN